MLRVDTSAVLGEPLFHQVGCGSCNHYHDRRILVLREDFFKSTSTLTTVQTWQVDFDVPTHEFRWGFDFHSVYDSG